MIDIPFIGIDPGLSGAISVIWPSGDCEVFDTPTVSVALKSGKKKRMYHASEMVTILKHILAGAYKETNVHVVIEENHARPGQGVTSMFSMGYGSGLWIGIITALGIACTKIPPQVWKKEFSLSKDKNLSMLRAKELFPKADITLQKHDGRAEALLLAEWGRRSLNSAPSWVMPSSGWIDKDGNPIRS